MLQLALATLLAGSLLAGGPDGDKDPTKTPAQEPIESIIVDNSSDELGEDDPINDTYALGRTERIPIKLWFGYGWAEDEEAYDASGEEFDVFGPDGSVTAQRAFVGAQINVINFTNFSVGAGGQLTLADNKVALVTPGGALDLESGFGLQTAKVYGIIRGRTLGVHAGYHFDLGDDAADLDPLTETTNSDGVDAWFVGANFDYPSEVFRLFGGIDYFNRDDFAASVNIPEPSPGSAIEDDEIVVFNAGAGVRISWVEIGAAALLRANLSVNRLATLPGVPATGGGHQGSIAPYLILSPPALPVSISVKGAFLSEYADYGYSLGGGGDLVTHRGFTVTASLGF